MTAGEIMRAAIRLDAQGDLPAALDLLRGHGLDISAAAVLLDAAAHHRLARRAPRGINPLNPGHRHADIR